MSRIKKPKQSQGRVPLPNTLPTTLPESLRNSMSVPDIPRASSYISSIDPPESSYIPITLSEQTPKGTRKHSPGRTYKGTVEFLSNDNAEYLYLTNSYVARGLDTESEAIVRNGVSAKATNESDQPYVDTIINTNNFLLLVRDINTYIGLYGNPMIEMFADKELKTTKFEILPPTEMDYIRDNSNKVMYDKNTGEPVGYAQKRDGKNINIWKGDDAKRIIEFKNRTLGGYIEGIPGIQSIIYPASEYGHIRSSVADSFIRSLPVCHIIVDGATPEDISEVTTAIGKKFTARTSYVTSERFKMENQGPSNDIDVFKFIEPTLSEIAACFHMPIEMLGATQYLKGDDFNDRYAEWIEHIKMRQRLIASIFERRVFNVLFPDGVTVKFNSPATIDTTQLLTNVGYAVQSNAIDSDMALEILVKAQVFGPYTDDILKAKKKPKEESKDGLSKEEEKVTEPEDEE